MLPAFHASGLKHGQPAALKPSSEGEAFAVIAGGGALPRLLAEGLAREGWRPVIVAVGDGMASDWSRYDATTLGWGRTGDVFPLLASKGVSRIAFCGTISARPDYRSLVPSWRTLRLMPEIVRIVRGGDDSLLRAVARAFENRGFHVHGVDEVLPELLTPEGALTARLPNEAEQAALARAGEAARRLGELDVGQAAVASADRVIALEGIEGTREMLERVADLRARGRIGHRERCVLFKSAKPQQDRRLDLPSIGLETLAQAKAAGLAGIGLTAGASLVIEAQALVEEAERAGLFLIGMSEAQP